MLRTSLSQIQFPWNMLQLILATLIFFQSDYNEGTNTIGLALTVCQATLCSFLNRVDNILQATYTHKVEDKLQVKKISCGD